jgi:hypothetical protein
MYRGHPLAKPQRTNTLIPKPITGNEQNPARSMQTGTHQSVTRLLPAIQEHPPELLLEKTAMAEEQLEHCPVQLRNIYKLLEHPPEEISLSSKQVDEIVRGKNLWAYLEVIDKGKYLDNLLEPVS